MEAMERILQSNIYIQPIHFFLAILTNTINIRILSSRTLRSSLCTYYFLIYSYLSLIYTCFICPILFARGFSINYLNGSINCKIFSYILFLLPLQANMMLILASIDRYHSSSRLYSYQSMETITRLAKQHIVLTSLVCIVFTLPIVVIYHWNEHADKCLGRFHLISQIYTFSQILIYYILSPIVLIILGLSTINNIHRQFNHSVIVILSQRKRKRRTQWQLTRMLILQITAHLIFVLPFGFIYSLNTLIPSTLTANVIVLRLIFVAWQQCDYFVSFFLYVFSASIYREQFFRIICKSNRNFEQISFHRHQSALIYTPSSSRTDDPFLQNFI